MRCDPHWCEAVTAPQRREPPRLSGQAPQPGWHWLPWLCELAGTAILLLGGLSAVFLDFGPASPVAAHLPSTSARLLLTGLLFAGTGSLVAVSPLGRVSGAHLNPVITLAFWTQGKVHPHDVVGYIVGQLLGAVGAAFLLALLWGPTAEALRDGVTQPGRGLSGPEAAAVEAVMTASLVLLVFLMTSSRRTARWTPFGTWVLVAALVWQGAPYTGTSLNPARSLGPALVASQWSSFWVYVVGPLAGGLLAVAVFALFRDTQVLTAKLFHDERYPGTPRQPPAGRRAPRRRASRRLTDAGGRVISRSTMADRPYAPTAASSRLALDRATVLAASSRALVLVEGPSDRIAVETLAARQGRDLAEERVAVVDTGGVTNIGHFLVRLAPLSGRVTLAGLGDEGGRTAGRSPVVSSGRATGGPRPGRPPTTGPTPSARISSSSRSATPHGRSPGPRSSRSRTSPVARPLETTGDEPHLALIAQPGQGDPATERGEPDEEVADVRDATGVDDGNPLLGEVPALARSEGLDGDPVTGTLDEDQGPARCGQHGGAVERQGELAAVGAAGPVGHRRAAHHTTSCVGQPPGCSTSSRTATGRRLPRLLG